MKASDLPVGLLIAIAEAAIKLIPQVVDAIVADAKLDERELQLIGDDGVGLMDDALARYIAGTTVAPAGGGYVPKGKK